VSKLGEFLGLVHAYERILIQLQVVCVVLLVLLVLSWLLKPPEPGSELYYIVLIDAGLVGIPLVGITVLRYVCSRSDAVGPAERYGR
jgi:vacuolar-type H+-ATPase subunit I/STV1